MGTVTQLEAAWQDRAMAASIQAVRGLVGPERALPAGTPIGRLSDIELGWLVAAVVFAWISTRAEQAATEGTERIQRALRTAPPQNGVDAWDRGAALSVLPTLASTANIDWSRPLQAWSRDEMADFLLLAVGLVRTAMEARELAR
jgi:hypothetical protein